MIVSLAVSLTLMSESRNPASQLTSKECMGATQANKAREPGANSDASSCKEPV